MDDMHYVGEHKGHKLIEERSPTGRRVYRLPEKLAGRGHIGNVVRALAAEGWSRSEINKVTGIGYQHVRNVLEDQGHVGAESPAHAGSEVDPETLGDLVVERDRVGSAVAFFPLVQHVERGGEVTITHDGRPVAQLVSFDAAQRMTAVRKAMDRMDEIRKRTNLGGLKIKDLINEGRR